MLRSDRPGFAIPLAVLLVVFLTVGISTAFTRVQTEARADEDRQARIDAFAYAQSGMEQFALTRPVLGFTSQPPAVVESTRIAMPGGYTDVVLRRVKPKTPTRQALYLLRSRGVRMTGAMSWMPPAEHTVAQYAHFREAQIQVLSAWTSLSGLIKNGTSGTITGQDGCNAQADVAGVALPDSSYTQSGGPTGVPTGNPPILYLGDQTTANNSVKIDWDAIVNQNAIWPDIYYPTDPWPSPWPAGYWPVIRVDGDLTLPNDGQGILIVTGDLVISGSLRWKGILLIGGTLYANGNNNVQGAVISGLNEKFGIDVAESDVGNGTKTYQYNSCNIANAIARLAVLVLVPKSWSDNWATW
jgi:hypothetical protein